MKLTKISNTELDNNSYFMLETAKTDGVRSDPGGQKLHNRRRQEDDPFI